MADYTRVPQQAIPVVAMPHSYTPLGYEQFTNLATAIGINPPTGALYALIQASGQDVVWRDDGTDPTATVGMVLSKGLEPWLYVGPMTAIKFIQTAASSTLNVTYYG